MPQTTHNGITLEYETHGDSANPALLLIMGLGAQLTLWPIELVDALVERGLYVIRHDNRDIGLSTKFTEAGVPDIPGVVMALMTGKKPAVPYTLSEMAGDAVAVLDAVGVAKAHIVGASMGGMIAQLVAVEHPERVLSLTSIMSSTGNPMLPPAKPEAMAALTAPIAPDADKAAILERGGMISRAIGSPGYPADPARIAANVTRDYDRSFHPSGAMRQMAAIVADGDRRARLKGVTAPTLVIHGADDPLVPVEGGRDTVAAIAGARIVEIPGMGHDLPLALVETIADAIAGHANG
ncbi:alpha/beta fold hydrolase [Novosphingobium sp. Gsoil 351]|uniref:alpha/beta fold hydrolase n=1 Tax=Novosphingobium sp. Gsoil 351 TaxID=2675225 RepID=UPI0012B44F76|nr:alpha/beta hydrolase [Novosphingobium sp. Gsoil 351]QGN54759.1 alpha/beta fold hydrolase [Novosphingobium sp. Gsoil 351]